MKHTLPLAKVIAIWVFGFTLSVFQVRAQQPPSPCESALNARIRELQAINTEIGSSGQLSDQTISRLLAFHDRFRRDAQDPTVRDLFFSNVEGAATGTLASLIIAGELGLIGTGVGAAIGAILVMSRRPVEIAGSWAQTDRNTAIYSWLLDYLEYGRVQPITPRLSEFLENNADVLRNLTGRTTPRRPGVFLPSNEAVQRYNAAARAYLQRNALPIFYFLGRFEERASSSRFPRLKFPDSVGRYGTSRMAVGYYRSVVAASLRSDLARLGQELERARTACRNRRPTNPGPSVPPLVVRTPSWDWYPGNTYRDMIGRRIQLHCAPNPERSYSNGAFGTDIYADGSSVCVAAVHAGLITFEDGGRVVIQVRPGQNGYRGSARNGVSTRNLGSWQGSFIFLNGTR